VVVAQTKTTDGIKVLAKLAAVMAAQPQALMGHLHLQIVALVAAVVLVPVVLEL
jgi:hypothetical protein